MAQAVTHVPGLYNISRLWRWNSQPVSRGLFNSVALGGGFTLAL